MNSKGLLLNLVIVGMTLGTTWAIRGQFGHEQGAAWAGAVGAIAILLIAKREDWYAKLFKATLAAAVGWGLGGMMSYGRVVGFGRGVEFVNVYYGLLMLFIIGGLYGFIGGGLFGLTLSDSKTNKVKWPLLVAGMVAGGLITYFFLVMQWEWLMTPPRSEVWAVCLGMALFMIWFLINNKNKAAIRVAIFSGLGGGFGFAFGNFLQVMGNLADIQFNMWNVMEYSLGFFGGLGMAYGTFTSEWEKTEASQKKTSNLVPILLVVFLIPFVVWDQTFELKKIQDTYSKIMEVDAPLVAWLVQIIALALILIQTGYVMIKYHYLRKDRLVQFSGAEVKAFFMSHFAIYIIFSFLITGAFVSTYRIEQYLYIFNYLIVLAVLPKLSPVFELKEINSNKWFRNFLLVLGFIAILAIIIISFQEELPGMNRRWEF